MGTIRISNITATRDIAQIAAQQVEREVAVLESNVLQQIHRDTDARVIRIIDAYIRDNDFYVEILTNPDDPESQYTWHFVIEEFSDAYNDFCSHLGSMIEYASNQDASLINDVNNIRTFRFIYNNRRRNRIICKVAFAAILLASVAAGMLWLAK